MQLHPAIEHGQGQLGNMPGMGRIRFKKTQGVFPAALQNIFRNQGHVIGLGIIIIEKAFAQAAAAGNELFGSRGLQKTANNAAAGQNNIATLGAETGNLFALLQIG